MIERLNVEMKAISKEVQRKNDCFMWTRVSHENNLKKDLPKQKFFLEKSTNG